MACELSGSVCTEESAKVISSNGEREEDGVLVSSMKDDDMGSERGQLVIVESCDMEGDAKEEVASEGEGNGNETLALFKELAKQFKSLLESNNTMNGSQFGEIRDTMRTMTEQLETLNGQIREMQVLFLKSSLSPSGSGKEENLIKVRDQVFQTPRKALEPPMRLDVTPVSSTHTDTSQQIGLNSRRTLAFPKSLEAMLDEDKENNNFNRGTTSRELRDGPTPTLTLVEKTDLRSGDSPHHGDSKLGLLVLADAALTRSPEQSTFHHRAGQPFTDYDSGRSTGNSCGSSPSTSQDALNIKTTDKFGRYGVYNHTNDLHGPKRAKLEYSSSSSTSYAKLRKRRKVKQPLPCNYCGKCFNNQSSLRQHESFHRPVRPFKCENEKCDKAYKTRSELNRHLVVHSGEKRHECKLCGKRFLRKQYLKTHLLRHHETGIAMIAPSAIDSFKDNSSGTIPSIVVSSSFVCKTEPLTWRCQQCFKIFVDNDDLTRHVRSYHEKKKSADGKLEIIITSMEQQNRVAQC